MSKIGKIIKGIIYIVVIIGIVASLVIFLTNHPYDHVSVPITELPSSYKTEIKSIREITMCESFPDFKIEELWFYKNDSNHTKPYLECSFKKEMTDEEFETFCEICNNVCWDSEKDFTLSFSRGWSKKEFMDIPNGMEEDMVVEINYLSNYGFTLSYHKNAKSEKIEDDFINNLTGSSFPSFTVVSYVNDGETTWVKLLFNNYIDKHIADEFSNFGDSMSIMIDTIINNNWIDFSMIRNERNANLIISNR